MGEKHHEGRGERGRARRIEGAGFDAIHRHLREQASTPPATSVDPASEVEATVKWFDPTKGFGFVRPTGGAEDAFLHAAALERNGLGLVGEGSLIRCRVARGARGLQVSEVTAVDNRSLVSPRPRRARPELHGDARETPGTVAFFDAAKGFGFVKPDDGGKDVFVHARVLHGLHALEKGQRVVVTWRMAERGPQAERVGPA